MKELFRLYFDDSKQDFIVCFSGDDLQIRSFDEVRIYYQGSRKIYITYDCLSVLLQSLKHMLKQALQNKLQVNSSITKDLGYVWNYVCKQKLYGLVFDENDNWVGESNLLWCSNRQTLHSGSAWLFNARDGNIVFEITPHYPFLNRNAKKNEQFISFESWIKRYKPHIVQVVSQKTVRTWLQQIDDVLQKIEGSDDN